MTANRKPLSARAKLAPKVALHAALALPFAGVLLAAGASVPALAEQPIALMAPTAAPFAAIAASGTLVEQAPLTAPQKDVEPTYQKVGSGMASYYGRELAGNRTASGERFNPSALTAAHRTLPLGSMVRVTNPRTGDSVIVRINDRGPFHSNRLIDLSEAAARQIGIRAAGSGVVELSVAD
ncbi:septal ring lytic transglycosylase RlpA family protein [Novosphingobium sp. 9U]|uniref:septal ring lytic transglycosylase RlpA family protein n=1 Tax=Novosphingobium sp. 9U TaxID=2653158 RepID=UPI0012F0E440|nr:septal ring lytic transglycosylase RlpA family protein [Novosphingobium sp. 9U]VWX51889.1 Endolytic peptidoglycan transglycosylase RlpA [Novosphingobium sp. 9U]